MTVKTEHAALEQAIGTFRTTYEPLFTALMDALDEAHISHYSSGCGTRKMTFDIFPASGCVRDMLTLLTMERKHKSRLAGLKDAVPHLGYNPATEFMQYLRRWIGFAEQVMQREGVAARGVAAARAKLLMEDLMKRLNESKAGKVSEFFKLMDAISAALLAQEHHEREQVKSTISQAKKQNYLQALAFAQGDKLQSA